MQQLFAITILFLHWETTWSAALLCNQADNRSQLLRYIQTAKKYDMSEAYQKAYESTLKSSDKIVDQASCFTLRVLYDRMWQHKDDRAKAFRAVLRNGPLNQNAHTFIQNLAKLTKEDPKKWKPGDAKQDGNNEINVIRLIQQTSTRPRLTNASLLQVNDIMYSQKAANYLNDNRNISDVIAANLPFMPFPEEWRKVINDQKFSYYYSQQNYTKKLATHLIELIPTLKKISADICSEFDQATLETTTALDENSYPQRKSCLSSKRRDEFVEKIAKKYLNKENGYRGPTNPHFNDDINIFHILSDLASSTGITREQLSILEPIILGYSKKANDIHELQLFQEIMARSDINPKQADIIKTIIKNAGTNNDINEHKLIQLILDHPNINILQMNLISSIIEAASDKNAYAEMTLIRTTLRSPYCEATGLASRLNINEFNQCDVYLKALHNCFTQVQ